MEVDYLKLVPVVEKLIRCVNCLDKLSTLTYSDYYFNRSKLVKRITALDNMLWNLGIDYRVYTDVRVGQQNRAIKYIANDC